MSAQAPTHRVFTYILTALVAAIAGFSLYQTTDRPSSGAPPGAIPEQILGSPRPDFHLPNLAGEPTPISRWDGEVVLVNFWATWCAPCRQEMPGFAALQQEYGERGFQAIGVALDSRQAVARFTERLGVHYPQLIGAEGGIAVARRYGNDYGALPYSVLIDRDGVIRFIKAGELSKQALETELLKLL
jgi:thiol-disulfide isomerase/thioredoxin